MVEKFLQSKNTMAGREPFHTADDQSSTCQQTELFPNDDVG